MTAATQILWGRYVGIPFAACGREFAGADCYGLVALVHREEFGIRLEDWSGLYWGDKSTPETRGEVFREAPRNGWVEIEPQAVEPGDVLSFRIGRHEAHCGIVVDRRRMLHVLEGLNAVIEDWRGPVWGPRFVQAYRHAGRVRP